MKDISISPGHNFEKAEFRIRMPQKVAALRAVLILVPGSDWDGRGMVDDEIWRNFAEQENVALVGCYFLNKPHDCEFIESYADASKGSGQALLDALNQFAASENCPEIATAPLLLWGFSAGGQFNYEFVAWKPERVAAFIVNKGGIYFSALLPKAARDVPGILFTGREDIESRIWIIKGLFALNRRAGALWALAEEPGAGHITGKSKELGLILFAAILAQSRPLTEQSGIAGDLETFELQPTSKVPEGKLTSWLPDERTARAWQSLVSGRWQENLTYIE